MRANIATLIACTALVGSILASGPAQARELAAAGQATNSQGPVLDRGKCRDLADRLLLADATYVKATFTGSQAKARKQIAVVEDIRSDVKDRRTRTFLQQYIYALQDGIRTPDSLTPSRSRLLNGYC